MDLNNIVFDSAMLYYDTTIDIETNIATLETYLKGKELGCSDGGVTFTSTPEVRQIPFAGSLERKIKGFERILKVEGKIEGEVLKLNEKTLAMSLYKKATVTPALTKHDKFTPITGVIPTSAYGDLLLVGTTFGEPILILLKNTYVEELSLDTKDKEEGKIKISCEGRYDSATAAPPIMIYVPKTVAA